MGERGPQLVQGGNLDLPDALGREPEAGADLRQGLRRRAEAVVRPDDRSFSFCEAFGQVAYVADLELVEYLLVGLLGGWIDNRVTDGGARLAVRARGLLRAAGSPLGCLEALHLCHGQAGRAAELGRGGLHAVGKDVSRPGAP